MKVNMYSNVKRSHRARVCQERVRVCFVVIVDLVLAWRIDPDLLESARQFHLIPNSSHTAYPSLNSLKQIRTSLIAP